MTAAPSLRLGTSHGRAALLALILASGTAFLDASVVAVALAPIERDLGGGFTTMQWVLDSYLLTLGAFLLVGGGLGDLLGKRRVFEWGVMSFGVASVLCGLAPTAGALVAARAVQGVAAALLVPGSLSIITAAFDDHDRPRAIGLWSGLAGLFTLLGPFVGGALVDTGPAGWRWVFWLNLPVVVVVLWLSRRHVPALPGTRTPGPLAAQVDVGGGLLAVLGLGLVAGPLIETARLGAGWTVALVGLGLLLLAALAWWERRCERAAAAGAARRPMLSVSLFGIRSFTVANVVTFLVYGAIGGVFFLVTVHLQVTLGWSALAAGAAGVPITLTLAAFSGRVGGLVPRLGTRWLLVAGCLVMPVGLAMFAGIEPGDTYLTGVLPAMLVFAAGLVLVVAPVTSSALADVGGARAGAASGVNNATARVANLVAVAALPAAAGIGPEALAGGSGATSLAAGFPAAMWYSAAFVAIGALAALAMPPSTGRVAGPRVG